MPSIVTNDVPELLRVKSVALVNVDIVLSWNTISSISVVFLLNCATSAPSIVIFRLLTPPSILSSNRFKTESPL